MNLKGVVSKAKKVGKDPIAGVDAILNRIAPTKLPTVPFIGDGLVRASGGSLPIADASNYRSRIPFVLSELLSTKGKDKITDSLRKIDPLGVDRLQKERTYKLFTGALGGATGAFLMPTAKGLVSPGARLAGEGIENISDDLPEFIGNLSPKLLNIADDIDNYENIPLAGFLAWEGLKRGRNLGQSIIDRRARSKILDKVNEGLFSRAELEHLINSMARRGIA